jgi:hypothetical protein
MPGQFRMSMILTGSVSLAAALFGEAASAQGQERNEPPGWSFTVAPYFWAAGIEGDVGVGDRQTEIDVDFSEIRENLKFGAMMLAEARKDRYGIFFAPLFVRLGDDTNEGPFNLDVTSDVAVVGGGAFFRIAEWDLTSSGEGSSRKAWIEPLAGARYTYIRAELNIDGPFGLNPDLDEHEEWIDPIIGASAGIELSRHWAVLVEGDVGGFGIGSDFTWNAIGLISYRTMLTGIPMQFGAGYRALSWNYDDDDFDWDVTMHGPVLGVSFQF